VCIFMRDLPERLYRRGRPADQDFELTEELYYRCAGSWVEADPVQAGVWRLKSSFIRFPEFSVNRQKYSQPEDVLLPTYGDWGVAAFTVGDVPSSVTSPGQTVVDFRVVHVPEEDNFSHSEVQSFKSNQRVPTSSKIPDAVKSVFRQRLCERAKVIRQPKA
jgi:hypothetical protein